MNNNFYDPNYILLNKKFVVLKDIIDIKLQKLIKDFLLDNVDCETNFPWYYNNKSVPDTYGIKNKIPNYIINDRPQFTHSFFMYDEKTNTSFKNSEFSFLVTSILNCFFEKTKIKNLNILRAKANLQIGHKNIENEILYPHYDFENLSNYFVLIYYVNNSEGNTILFNDDNTVLSKIEHKQGDILFAKGNILHSGTYPTFNNTRCLINIDLKNFYE
jgi:hypothetical protein